MCPDFHRRPLVGVIKLTLLFPLSPVAFADESAAANMVVTAAGFEQNQEDAPASITVIKGEDLRKRSFQNLGDAVREVEGVVVNGAANETDISIRGMPADYTLLLVDGKRQSGRDSRVNGNAGYEQSFVPPAAAIERIEV
ncbi:TonB-dependent receptor plug domain-containing protein, partial [Winslowiella iniecta]